MKATKKPWEKAPKNKRAARDEVHALDRRRWIGERRREFLVSWLRNTLERLPDEGSMWLRSVRLEGLPEIQTLYEYLHHAYGEKGTFFVLRTVDDYGDTKRRREKAEREGRVRYANGRRPDPQVVVVSPETFALEFDPAPAKRARKKGRAP